MILLALQGKAPLQSDGDGKVHNPESIISFLYWFFDLLYLLFADRFTLAMEYGLQKNYGPTK